MQPSFLRGMRQDIHKKEYKKRNRINSFFKRAGGVWGIVSGA
mgnify:CR=1 FL=1